LSGKNDFRTESGTASPPLFILAGNRAAISPSASWRAEGIANDERISNILVPSPDASLGDGEGAARLPYQES
jgi:hypothetical protein